MALKIDEFGMVAFGIRIDSQIAAETETLRGDIPRSRWMERALLVYNQLFKEKEGKRDIRNPVWPLGSCG